MQEKIIEELKADLKKSHHDACAIATKKEREQQKKDDIIK